MRRVRGRRGGVEDELDSGLGIEQVLEALGRRGEAHRARPGETVGRGIDAGQASDLHHPAAGELEQEVGPDVPDRTIPTRRRDEVPLAFTIGTRWLIGKCGAVGDGRDRG